MDSRDSASTRLNRVAEIISAYSDQGVHRTGTEVDRLSAEWLVQEIHRIGVAAELDAFTFTRMDVVNAELVTRERTIPGVPLFDGGSTNAQGIQGRLGNPGDQDTIGFMTIPAADGGLGINTLNELRARTTHRGLIVMAESQGSADEPALLNAESFPAPIGVPVLQVPRQFQSVLSALQERGDEVRLVAHCTRESAQAFNVQGHLEGRDRDAAPLVIMTPRSGWWRCASERGGGIAAFLEMIRAFNGNQPRRSVVFTANTGHELAHLGLDHFLRQRPSLIEQAHAWIHLGANFAAADSPVLMQFSDPELVSISQSVLAQSGLRPDRIAPTGERPLGEARNVYDAGGRYVSLLGGNRLFHHPDDTWPHAVDLGKAASWVGAMTSIAVTLSG